MQKKKAEIIAISSGKGGVGKTTLTVNLGIALSRINMSPGLKVCLFDADTNLANINILLRETPEYTLQHVLDGEKEIADILIHSNGISFIPGASGVTEFDQLNEIAQSNLLTALSQLEEEYDVILVDTSAGIHDNVLDFIQVAHQSLIVITPEPTSLTDAFSLLRMLRKRKYRKRINVVVNHAPSELGGRKIFKRFSAAVAKYIGYHPAYLGYINQDSFVSSAVCSQVPIRIYRPDAISSRCFDHLSENLISLIEQQGTDKSLVDAWRKQNLELPEEELLPSTVSSPVPGTEPVVTNQQNDDEDKSAISLKYKKADKARKKQLLEEHKHAIREYIDDAENSKQDVALTLDHFLSYYFKRFKDYPCDVVEVINSMLASNALPQSQINLLLSELMLFYKDNKIRIDRDFNAEFLNQQIEDYVTEYGQYPFDTSQALMQSISLGKVSKEAILDLEKVMGLLLKSKLQPQTKLPEQIYVTDVEVDRKDLAEEITQQIDNVKKSEEGVQSLLDSIYFASRI